MSPFEWLMTVVAAALTVVVAVMLVRGRSRGDYWHRSVVTPSTVGYAANAALMFIDDGNWIAIVVALFVAALLLWAAVWDWKTSKYFAVLSVVIGLSAAGLAALWAVSE